MSKFYTVGDNLLVRVMDELNENKTASGLFISLKDKDTLTGVVEVAGPGRYVIDGDLVKGVVKAGDTVHFSRRVATPFDWKEGEKHFVVSEQALFGYERE